LNAVETGRRIQDQMACGQLDGVHAIGVLDEQFTSVVIVRVVQEQCR
jgi:hypothetical protein